jgi:hypothetical protein
MTNHSGHRWKFVRVGGVEQVIIRSGEDIVNLEHLDQKLWVALACPVKHLEFDQRTLELLDLDKDGRIRPPEIVAVSQWVREVFTNPDQLLRGGDTIELSAIRTETETGKSLLHAAKAMLAALGRTQANAFSLADVAAGAKAFLAKPLNGDGVIVPESTDDENIRRSIAEILATVGGVSDRTGKQGINSAKAEAFFAEAGAFLAWHDKADSAILPLGPATVMAVEMLKRVRAKIDDYFTRARLVAYDPRAVEALNQAEAEFRAMSAKDLTIETAEVARLPLALAGAAQPLSLEKGLNPAWVGPIAMFRRHTLEPLLGPMIELQEKQWAELQDKLAPYVKWLAEKPTTTVEELGPARLRELIAPGMRESISNLIARDAAEEPVHQEFVSLEKLARVQRDLFRLLNNFVSFSDFYQRRGAIFQAGTLFLDARSCDLCVHVADPAKHAALAGLARTYLTYCDCARGGEKMSIAAAFTAGDSDHLMLGRNGVFYDRKGRDWDATITKIIDNPISLGQAFWAPYKKFVRIVEEQIAKRAAAADTAAQAKLGTSATHLVSLEAGKPAPAQPEKKVDVGTVAALGVALGSIGTFFAMIFGKFVELGWWIPFALVGVVLAISGPSVIIAWLKLRQRNLGPILDANGWAVNGRMNVNVPFGGALSKRARIPPGSEVQLADPFPEEHRARNRAILFGVVAILIWLLWNFDLLNSVLPERMQHKARSPEPPATNAPAARAPGASL